VLQQVMEEDFREQQGVPAGMLIRFSSVTTTSCVLAVA